eukprot:scaffold517_cov255-Pinguiococcus_pyrenoidosus.AAC.19
MQLGLVASVLLRRHDLVGLDAQHPLVPHLLQLQREGGRQRHVGHEEIQVAQDGTFGAPLGCQRDWRPLSRSLTRGHDGHQGAHGARLDFGALKRVRAARFIDSGSQGVGADGTRAIALGDVGHGDQQVVVLRRARECSGAWVAS